MSYEYYCWRDDAKELQVDRVKIDSVEYDLVSKIYNRIMFRSEKHARILRSLLEETSIHNDETCYMYYINELYCGNRSNATGICVAVGDKYLFKRKSGTAILQFYYDTRLVYEQPLNDMIDDIIYVAKHFYNVGREYLFAQMCRMILTAGYSIPILWTDPSFITSPMNIELERFFSNTLEILGIKTTVSKQRYCATTVLGRSAAYGRTIFEIKHMDQIGSVFWDDNGILGLQLKGRQELVYIDLGHGTTDFSSPSTAQYCRLRPLVWILLASIELPDIVITPSIISEAAKKSINKFFGRFVKPKDCAKNG